MPSNKLLVKLRAEYDEYKRTNNAQQVLENNPRVANSRVEQSADNLWCMLQDIKLKTTINQPLQFRVRDEVWLDFIEQLELLSKKVRLARRNTKSDEDETLPWGILINRIGHADVYAWLHQWRLEVLHQLEEVLAKTQRKTTKFRAIYNQIKDSLANIKAEELAVNIEKATAAFDCSSQSRKSTVIALNCIIKAMQLWLPVFAFDQV